MKAKVEMEDIIQNIVDRIEKGCNPEKIILFGSYAEGSFDRDSDIDLLVIKESAYRRDERDKEVRCFLDEIKYPLDIFVYTPQEVEKFSNLKGSFINDILNSGRVVYEKQ